MISSTFWFLCLSLLLADSAFAAPVISEVLASNKAGLSDENGDRSDWIEIHNPDSSALDLNGWFLSDEAAKPMKWRFPAVNLPAGGYLVIFCSNKNRFTAGSELHTNFELNAGGETLYLTEPNGNRVQQLKFTQQFGDIAYNGADFLTPPTPAASNASANVAIVRAPVFSEPRGFKAKAFNLTLSSGTVGAQIFYTLDGTTPTSSSKRYLKPLSITKTTPVRAIAMVSGKQASPVITSTYLFVTDMVKQSLTGKAPPGWPSSWGANSVDYGLDSRIAATGKFAKALPNALKSIPTMAITMPLPDLFDAASGIYANPEEKGADWERAASIELLNADSSPGFQINAGLRIRGGASRSPENPKHSFRVLMRKDYGAEFLDYPLFGAQGSPRTERFDLRCEQLIAWHYFVDPNADFIRDIYGRTIQGTLGQPHNRSAFYHLVINGQYWGLYQTEERVSAEYATSYFGGEESDYDVVKVNYDIDTIGGGTDFIDGSFGAWRRAVALGGRGFDNNANYFFIQGMNENGTRNPMLTPLIDVDNLIDYMIAGIYIAADDSPPAFGTQNNWGGIRSRKGEFGFRFFAHDWEISMQDPTGQENRVGEHPAGNPFLQDTTTLDPTSANPWHFWQAMRANAEFRLRVADHVQKHFYNNGPLTQTKATALWRQFMDTIDQAVIGESARWGDARRESRIQDPLDVKRAANKQVRHIQLLPGQAEDDLVQALDVIIPRPSKPNPPVRPFKKPKPFTRDDWLNACNNHILGGFLSNRTSHVLEHFRQGGLMPDLGAPEMSPYGGLLSAGTSVVLTPPADVEGNSSAVVYFTTNGSDPRLVGGAISGKATAYTTPISVAKNSTIKARSYQGGKWSALTEAKFEVSTDYGALRITEINYNPTAPISDTGEFIEIQNTGKVPLILSGAAFTEGIDYVFPLGTSIAAGAMAVVARDPVAFSTRYGFTPLGPYTGKLSNEGETVTLSSPSGSRITSLKYDDEAGWPSAPDGFGHSLVFDGKGDPDDAKNWHASTQLGGSPASTEAVPSLPISVFINELTQEDSGVSIELQNLSTQGINLTGWTFISGSTQLTLSTGYMIPPSGRIILSGTELAGLTFDAPGGTLSLQRPVQEVKWRDAVHRFRYGPLTLGVSYARQITSEGREFFPQQRSVTLGEIESGPKIPDLRITEIYYHAKPPANTGPAFSPLPDLEFVELQNTSKNQIDLSGYRLVGINYVFPEGTILAGRAIALVIMSDPGLFRARYGIDPEVLVLGPAAGSLDRDGERVALEAPVTVSSGAAFVVVEELDYTKSHPWPVLAAGRGHSLQRLSFAGYSADAASWGSALPSPGLLNTVNAPPSALLTQLAGPPNSRTIEFTAKADDVDGQVRKIEFIVDGYVTEETTKANFTFSYIITRGIHDLWIRVTDDQGASTLSDSITLDAENLPDGAGLGLLAEFFSNPNLEGAPAHTETVTTIGGDWFHLDPAVGVSRNGFSVRYSGKMVPRSNGMHTFHVQTTGGVKIWIGDTLLVDAWNDPLTSNGQVFEFELDLKAAKESALIIEYQDSDGMAHLSLLMKEPGKYNPEPPLSALLYHPDQDANVVVIGRTQGLERRFLGQKFSHLFQLLNAPVVDEEVDWSIKSGSLPPGVSLSNEGLLQGVCRAAGKFDFIVQATLPDLREVESSLTLQVIDRSIRAPSLVVTAPKSIVVTSRFSGITARGTITSSRPIAAIHYSLNGGLEHRLTGAAQWSLEIPHLFGLKGGQNELSIQAVDVDGRFSELVTAYFSRQYPSKLTADTEGAGTLSSGFLGITPRTVGKNYTIVATPAPGFIFSHWSGDLPVEDPRLTFTMADEMRLKAHFVVSPFTRYVGSYTGLLSHEETLSQNTRCRIRVTMTQQGMLSGLAHYDALAFSFTGKFSAQGTTYITAHHRRTNRTLNLFFKFDAGTGLITVSSEIFFNNKDVVNKQLVMQASLAKIQSQPPSDLPGRWNKLLPPSENSPQAHGFLSLLVSKTGSVNLTGRLPTGLTFIDSAQLTEDGTVPIYVSLSFDAKTSRKESLSGIANFPIGRNTILRATYLWAAAFEPDQSPSDLFAHELVSEGSLWQPLASGEPFLKSQSTEMSFTSGGITAPVRLPISLGSAPTHAIVTSGGETVKISLNRSTGSMTGSLTFPPRNGLPRRSFLFRALAHPAANRVGGHFKAADGSTGNVEIGQSR